MEESDRLDKLLPMVCEHYNFVVDDCNKNGTTLVTTLLQGQQNYNMDDEESDVDTKSLGVPNFGNWYLVLNEKAKLLLCQTMSTLT